MAPQGVLRSGRIPIAGPTWSCQKWRRRSRLAGNGRHGICSVLRRRRERSRPELNAYVSKHQPNYPTLSFLLEFLGFDFLMYWVWHDLSEAEDSVLVVQCRTIKHRFRQHRRRLGSGCVKTTRCSDDTMDNINIVCTEFMVSIARSSNFETS